MEPMVENLFHIQLHGSKYMHMNIPCFSTIGSYRLLPISMESERIPLLFTSGTANRNSTLFAPMPLVHVEVVSYARFAGSVN